MVALTSTFKFVFSVQIYQFHACYEIAAVHCNSSQLWHFQSAQLFREIYLPSFSRS